MENRNFHTAFLGGFRKKDVVNFLAEDKRRQEESLQELNGQLEEAAEQIRELMEQRDNALEQVQALCAQREELQAALEAARQEGRTPVIAIFVGSEGGFSPDEAGAAADMGAAMTGLGKRILRTETASGFVLSCLIYALEL